MSHAALVRGEDNALHVRSFRSADDAAAAASAREIAPESPAIPPAMITPLLEQMRLMGVRKVRVTSVAPGTFEVEALETNRLYVSRYELAELLPKFSEVTDRERYVDRLTNLGMPCIRATGTPMYNVPKVIAWLEKWFEQGGGKPTTGKASP